MRLVTVWTFHVKKEAGGNDRIRLDDGVDAALFKPLDNPALLQPETKPFYGF